MITVVYLLAVYMQRCILFVSAPDAASDVVVEGTEYLLSSDS